MSFHVIELYIIILIVTPLRSVTASKSLEVALKPRLTAFIFIGLYKSFCCKIGVDRYGMGVFYSLFKLCFVSLQLASLIKL